MRPELNQRYFVEAAAKALDIIEKLPLTGSLDGQWRKLLKSKHANVRAFGARKLAANDNPATNRLMMGLLAHDDVQVSEIAAGALARHKKATKLLLGALAGLRSHLDGAAVEGVVVAAEDAVFGVTEVARGLYPMAGSTIRLRRQIPYCLAYEDRQGAKPYAMLFRTAGL